MSETVSLASWLRRRKHLNELELYLMGVHFDFEGAIEAGQYGSAWNAQENILHCSILIFAARRGFMAPLSRGRAENVRLTLEEIRKWNPACADRGWELSLRTLDLSADGVCRAFEEVKAFATGDLGIESAASRADAIKAWAESVHEMRKVGSLVGIAGSDAWYLPDPSDEQGQADWFEQVMRLIEDSASEIKR